MKNFVQFLVEMYPFPVPPSEVIVQKAPEAPTMPPEARLTDKTPSGPSYDLKAIRGVIRDDESAGAGDKIYKVYKDSKGLDTIGHGHLVTKETPKIFKDVLKIDFEPIRQGKTKLTPQQADMLLDHDIGARMKDVVTRLPNFGKYSPGLQAALASEHYRGMLLQSPKALDHIKNGRFTEAADEYLNAKEYREAKAKKLGTAKRMERLADALRNEKASK